MPRILATLALRTNKIAQRARDDFGIDSVPAASPRRALSRLALPGRRSADLTAQLAAKNVYVSVRGSAMRVTPHLWTTDEDVERLFAALKMVAR